MSRRDKRGDRPRDNHRDKRRESRRTYTVSHTDQTYKGKPPPVIVGFWYRFWGLLFMTVDQKAQVANAREEQQMSNENETQTSAEVTSPISDEVVEAASEAGWEALRPRDWPTAPAMPPWATAPAYLRAESRITVRASLEAAYPAIRQQVAEEIAVALDERHRSNLALSGGDKGIIPRDGRVGLATGYQRAAQIAREHAAR